ncbi:hypothetical protein FHX08_000268 [Rhizobium sp. BK529]|nr:hypothetical protein [Rhizobium sp. BK529]
MTSADEKRTIWTIDDLRRLDTKYAEEGVYAFPSCRPLRSHVSA